jgi:membrane protein
LGASGVFGQLQGALNTIWEVEPKPGRGILETVKARLFSFTLVLGVGFLLLVSLILDAVLSVAGDFLAGFLPGSIPLVRILNYGLSAGLTFGLIAAIFKVVPDAKIRWRDVWLGALVTTILFFIARLLMGLYLGSNATASAYGAAGSLVLLLLWIYASAQILFLGAEFTQVYARMSGVPIAPDESAVALTEETRIQQGMPKQATVARKRQSAAAETRLRMDPREVAVAVPPPYRPGPTRRREQAERRRSKIVPGAAAVVLAAGALAYLFHNKAGGEVTRSSL